MPSFPEARPFLPIDLPLVRRLTPHGVSLDSLTSLTRGINTIEGAFWGAVPLTDLGTPTFVLKDGDNGYVAQFRHKGNDQHAHIVFIAPDLDKCEGDDPWLHLLDAMVVAAGKRGAVTLNAEVGDTSAAFTVLRQAGFAVYARQEIWKREPGGTLRTMSTGLVRPETESDAFGINSLYANVVPPLVLQADAPPVTGHGGLVYERDGKILAYLSVQEGKCGVYIQSFLHAEGLDQAERILAACMANLSRAERVPVYFCVRSYQDWWRRSLNALGFESWASQAVMVKHTASRIGLASKSGYKLDGAARIVPPIIDCDGRKAS